MAYRNTGGRISHSSIDELVRILNFIELDEPAWNAFSVIKAGLLRDGKPGPNFDTLLASIAIVRNLIIVTNNVSHFRNIGVGTENWVAGYLPEK